MNQKWVRSATIYLVLSIISFAVVGCFSIRLVADYDPKIDEEITALQKKTEVFLIKQERTCQTPEGAYSQNISFYDDAKADISVLQARADALALNKLTSEQIRLLRNSLEDMEAQHKKGFTPLVVANTRRILNTHFAAILKLELAKKRETKE